MTTINEIAREEGGSFDCGKNNLNREETIATPEVSCKDFFNNKGNDL